MRQKVTKVRIMLPLLLEQPAVDPDADDDELWRRQMKLIAHTKTDPKKKQQPETQQQEEVKEPQLQKKKSFKTPGINNKQKMSTEEEIEELRESFTCPITGKLIREPISTPYGHMYEKEEIEKWVKITGECPITKQPLQQKDLMK